MYRCDMCQVTVPPGTPQSRYALKRVSTNPAVNGQIERELKLCPGCLSRVTTGEGYQIPAVVAEDIRPPVVAPAPVSCVSPAPLRGKVLNIRQGVRSDGPSRQGGKPT